MNYKKLNTIQTVIAYSLFPVLITGGLLTTYFLLKSGMNVMVAMLIPVLFSNATIWIFEFIQPYNLDWRPPGKSLRLDIFYAVSTSLLLTPFLKMGILTLLDKYNIVGSGIQVWPSHFPLLIQLIMAILLADLFVWCAHFWMHNSKLGWKIHVIHHSTVKMHFWAGSRSHPLNAGLIYAGEVGMLLLLGINTEVLALFTVFVAINGVLEHANIELRHGFLNRIFSTAEVHRVHHSTSWEYSNQNFGTSTTIWDQVFGTYTLPPDPVRIQGIVMHKLPENYLLQLFAPFVLDKYKVKKETFSEEKSEYKVVEQQVVNS